MSKLLLLALCLSLIQMPVTAYSRCTHDHDDLQAVGSFLEGGQGLHAVALRQSPEAHHHTASTPHHGGMVSPCCVVAFAIPLNPLKWSFVHTPDRDYSALTAPLPESPVSLVPTPPPRAFA